MASSQTVFVKTFTQRVEEDGRVKAVDIHQTEPLVLCALYNGKLTVYNYQTCKMVNETTVCAQQPIRTAQFVTGGKIICGADDMNVYLLRMHNMKKIWKADAHADYIRSIAHHPTKAAFLSASDDMSIKYWTYTDDDRGTQPVLQETFEGHTHYVMAVRWNPIDDKRFASVSLDRVLREWWIESGSSSTTYDATQSHKHDGHVKGINCVDYDHDNQSIASGDDSLQTIVWNIESRQPIWTLKDHSRNVTAVKYTEEYLLTASEDGSIKAYRKDEGYKLMETVNLGMERCWCLAANDRVIVAGFDKGFTVFDNSPQTPYVRAAKGVMVKFHNNVTLYTLKSILSRYSPADGQSQTIHLDSGYKDLGSAAGTDLQISKDGRYVSVVEPTGFTVYNSKNISKSKYNGDGSLVVWRERLNSTTPLVIAVLAMKKRQISVHNFQSKLREFDLQGGSCNKITGGKLITAFYDDHLEFYDWDSMQLVQTVDSQANNTYWSNDLLMLAASHSTYLLKYTEGDEPLSLRHEEPLVVASGLWLSSDVFVFLTPHKRLYAWTRGLRESVRIGTVDDFESSKLLLQQYMAKKECIIITDYTLRETKMVVFHIPYSYLEAVAMVHSMEVDEEEILELASKLGNKVLRSNLARLCEESDYVDLALRISTDMDYKFSLALKLDRLQAAMQYAAATPAGRHRKSKYRLLTYKALLNADLSLAVECANRASDFSTLSIVHTLLGDKTKLEEAMEVAKVEGMMNHAFDIAFKIGRLDSCLEILLGSKRGCEATMFAANYLPERVQEAFEQWKGFLREEGLNNEADRLVCPTSDLLKASLTPNVPLEKIKMCSQIPAQHWPKIQSIALSSTYDEKTASLFKDVKGAEPVVVESPPPDEEDEGALKQDESKEEDKQTKEEEVAPDHSKPAEELKKTLQKDTEAGVEAPVETPVETPPDASLAAEEQTAETPNTGAVSPGEKSEAGREGTSEFNTEELEDISDLDDIDLDAPISDEEL